MRRRKESQGEREVQKEGDDGRKEGEKVISRDKERGRGRRNRKRRHDTHAYIHT